MSAAFTRMMHARGDFTVFHEPFQVPYARKFAPDYAAITYGPEEQATYEDVKNTILAAANQRAVFVKDMSFNVEYFLLRDQDFITNENVHFVFLLRHPHDSILSFYNKSRSYFPYLSYLLGYEPFYNLFQHIKQHAKNPLTVVLAKELSTHPEQTVKSFCSSLQIPFIPESLHWKESLDYQKEWHEIKSDVTMQLWHGDALRSTEFAPLTKYAVDNNGNPTFAEITDPVHKEMYQESYQHNLRFYNLLQNDPDFKRLTKKASMEHVQYEAAIPHNNSAHCIVYEYPTKSSDISIAVAKITHRYPDEGYAVNHKCTEMGYVLKGSGKLVTQTKEANLSEGDVVYIAPGEKFYWEGNLTIVLPTTPAWTPDQYELLPQTNTSLVLK